MNINTPSYQKSIPHQTQTVIIFFAITICCLFIGARAQAQTQYTRQTNISALRVTVDQINVILQRTVVVATDMARSSSSDAAHELTKIEEVTVSAGDYVYKFDGLNQFSSNQALPEIIDRFEFSWRIRTELKGGPTLHVSDISIRFSSFERQISVSGSSLYHIDVISKSISTEFDAISSWVGGATISGMLLPLAIICFFITISICGGIKNNNTNINDMTIFKYFLRGIAVSTLLFVLWYFDILTGFSASRTDPSFVVRFGPEITLVGLIISIFPILRNLMR